MEPLRSCVQEQIITTRICNHSIDSCVAKRLSLRANQYSSELSSSQLDPKIMLHRTTPRGIIDRHQKTISPSSQRQRRATYQPGVKPQAWRKKWKPNQPRTSAPDAKTPPCAFNS